MTTTANNGPFVRTVTGDVSPEALGATNYHEHLFQVSPLLPGDELTDELKSSTEAGLLKASGFDTMVDATPIGLGRNPVATAKISVERALRVIATTGRHREAHYAVDHWTRSLTETALAEILVRDLTEALPQSDGPDVSSPRAMLDGTPVRAGILKAGIDYWKISPFEHQTLIALSRAQRVTGAPVMIHIEHGTLAHEVLDILDTLGVSASCVALAHMDRNLDPGLHVSLIERGAFLGYDGMARAKIHSDHDLISLTHSVVDAAGAHNILLGGDVARASRYIAYGGMPGMQYLGERYIPRLRIELGPEAVSHLLVTNPARWLSWTPPH